MTDRIKQNMMLLFCLFVSLFFNKVATFRYSLAVLMLFLIIVNIGCILLVAIFHSLD